MIITICTSYKFIPEMLRVYEDLTDMGHLVFLPAFLGKKLTIEEYMDIHYRKIERSDAIFVVNVDGYIGKSVQKEIDYAKRKGISVYYLEK